MSYFNMGKKFGKRAGAVVLLLAILLSLLPQTAFAVSATYTVTGDTTGTYFALADAVSAANTAGTGDYTIEVNDQGEETLTAMLTIDAGVNITLTSAAATDADRPVITSVATANIRHFTVNGALTLENVVLDGADTSGGVTVNSTGELTMKDGSAIQNCAVGNGGGVFNSGSFTMEGGAISGNTATASTFDSSGGGVYNSGSFTMEGGAISGNTAT
ncbi:MAG: hypothetical protein LUG13_07890, partial [Oscillospiraceae bacterium]|nr:hypothetical protein [Oscillospiraceae bacterium]